MLYKHTGFRFFDISKTILTVEIISGNCKQKPWRIKNKL